MKNLTKYLAIYHLIRTPLFILFSITILVGILSFAIDYLKNPALVLFILVSATIIILVIIETCFGIYLWHHCKKNHLYLSKNGQEILVKLISTEIILHLTDTNPFLPRFLKITTEHKGEKITFFESTWSYPRLDKKITILFESTSQTACLKITSKK